jgi:hypothetical protein
MTRTRTISTLATRADLTTTLPATPDDDDEFGRFEDLARKLIAVPKSEIDAERAK